MVDVPNLEASSTAAGNQAPLPGPAPARRGGTTTNFRGMSVRQIVNIGENRDPKGAVNRLVELAKSGNHEAIQALKGAARAAKYKPQCTFSATAKNLDITKIAPNSVGKALARTAVSSRKTAPYTNYSKLTKLLKFEYRGRTNTVRGDTNLLTGKTKVGDENSLTIEQFHENLEDKGVANIAVAWFEELEKCNLKPTERIELQTGLVKTLEQLQKSFIVDLEEIRASGTSGPGQDLKGLSIASDYSSQDLKQLVKLRAQFKMQPLDQFYELINANLSPKRIELLKDLIQRFPEVRLKELNEVADLLEAKKISMERFKKLYKLFPEEQIRTLFFAVRDLETDEKWNKFVKLKEKYPKALAGALSEAVIKLVTVEDWIRFNKLESRHSEAPFSELVDAAVFFKDEAGLERLKKLKKLFPNAPLRSLQIADLYLNKEEPMGSKRMARTKELRGLFEDATLGTLANAASRLNDEGMERLRQLKKLFPNEPFNEFRGRLGI